jgi:tRNA pseudouridine38-40 synthase
LPPFDDAVFEAAMSVNRDDGLLSVVAERTGFHTHARNLSVGKWYGYRVRTDGVDDPRAWTIEGSLERGPMEELAAIFIGQHDFSAYCFKSSSQARLKTIVRVDLVWDAAGLTINIEGDGFLRHMVRKMVATLVAVGLGEFELEWAANLLSSASPRGTPMGAPACGLTLMAIRRPSDA